MRNYTLHFPAHRTAFIFGRQVAQLPVDFEASHFQAEDEAKRPQFVLSLSTLTQQVEVWPTRLEVIGLVRFLQGELKRPGSTGHCSDL